MYRALPALALLFLFGLFAVACDSGNPVAPPPPDDGGGSGGLTVTLSASPARLEAGSSTPATLTVTARQNNVPVADGTEANLSTSLGQFGVDAAGQPVRTASVRLTGGSGTVQLQPGSETGTANILAQVGTGIGRLSLAIVEPSPRPVADFTFEVDGLSVLFTDASTGDPSSFEWTFGDGSRSSEQSPMHTYETPGTYTATLRVTSSSGSNSKSKFVVVGEAPPLIAAFAFESNRLNVLFTDQSTGDPVSWRWSFGDGRTSTARNPSHAYSQAGTYAVELTVTNEFGITASASRFVTVSLGDPPQADFQFQADGLRVLFTDISTGNPTRWTWDFGDGTTSTARNPAHTYAQAGTYNVTLTAGNTAGSTSKSKFVTVSLGTAPQADFEFQVNGLNVVFQDRSTNGPTSWTWDFGDGSTSTARNPSHTYAQPGTYTVRLTASNAAGAGTMSKLVTVSTTAPPVANFCYQRNKLVVIFTDASSQNPTSWQWNFGDCEIQGATCKSTAENPGHTYLQAGTYAVTLIAANASGQSTRSKFVDVSETTIDLAPICN